MQTPFRAGQGDRLTDEASQGICCRVGSKGLHLLTWLLYCDLSCLFPLPIGHAFLFGIISDLVGHLLGSLSDIKPSDPDCELVIGREAGHLITTRGAFIVVTSDFGRQYIFVLSYRRTFRGVQEVGHDQIIKC